MPARPRDDGPAAEGATGGRRALEGIVVKTPSHQVIEVLAADGVTLVMIDAEHGQIGLDALDPMLAMSSALAIDALVRVPSANRVEIQRALDAGATGVVVPHVSSAAAAAEAVRCSQYGPDGRGFAASTRSAGWGTRPISDVLATAAERTVVVVQIEDVDGVAGAEEIAATDGVDGVFVGTADLTVAMGKTTTSDPDVTDACTRIIKAAQRSGRAVVAYAIDAADAARWRDAGANLIWHGSDQSRLRR